MQTVVAECWELVPEVFARDVVQKVRLLHHRVRRVSSRTQTIRQISRPIGGNYFNATVTKRLRQQGGGNIR